MKAKTLKDAAELLEMPSHRLFQILRDQGVIGSKNLARREYTNAGFFRVAYREFRRTGTNFTRQYAVTTVTEAGLSFLQDLIDGVGTARQLLDRELGKIPSEHGQSSQENNLSSLGTANSGNQRMATPGHAKQSSRS